MRTSLFVLALLVLTVLSCTKHGAIAVEYLGTDSGCIERIYIPESLQSISSTDLQLVDSLFFTNGLVNNHYRFTQYTHDSLQTYYPPYAKKDEKCVRADHYANGLRFLSDIIGFNFINDTLTFIGGDTTSKILLDSIPTLQLAQVRKLFIDDAQRFEQLGYHFKDTCLRAEFGYYRQSDNPNDRVYKAWFIKPHYNNYPYSIHLDSAGVFVGYNNGRVYIN